jgi:hypothetical protein
MAQYCLHNVRPDQDQTRPERALCSSCYRLPVPYRQQRSTANTTMSENEMRQRHTGGAKNNSNSTKSKNELNADAERARNSIEVRVCDMMCCVLRSGTASLFLCSVVNGCIWLSLYMCACGCMCGYICGRCCILCIYDCLCLVSMVCVSIYASVSFSHCRVSD